MFKLNFCFNFSKCLISGAVRAGEVNFGVLLGHLKTDKMRIKPIKVNVLCIKNNVKKA